MSGQLRAIFFDAGNTLVYPRVEELAEALTQQGYPATAEDFFAAERQGKQQLDEWLWPQLRRGELPPKVDHFYWAAYLKAVVQGVGAPEAEHPRLMARIGQGFATITFWSRVYPETPPFLEKLRAQGYQLGVISNSIGTMEQQLQRVDLARHFQVILDSAVVGAEKPHPEIFRVALERANVTASEALFVGDTYATDIGGAQLAGLRGVLIDRVGAYAKVDCPRIRQLPELEKYL